MKRKKTPGKTELQKICPTCGGKKSVCGRTCLKCLRKQQKEKSLEDRRQTLYYWKNKSTISKKRKYKRWLTNREITELVLTHYGDGTLACAHCGIDDIRVLTIDHVRGKKNYTGYEKLGGVRLLRYLYLKNYPDGFQTLCRNCNWLKYIKERDGEDSA